jgi:serine/threonine protein kinase
VSVELFDDAVLERKVVITRFPVSQRCDASWLAQASSPWMHLAHPNIAGLYQVGCFADEVQVVSEALAGPNLLELSAHELDPDLLETLVIDIGSGLHYAHARKIAHGSLSLEAAVIGPDLRVRLMRWSPEHLSSWLDDWVSGPIPTIMYYQAPEQIRGEMNEMASDIYAFGMMLYRALSGGFPFDGADLPTLCGQILSQTPEPLSVPDGFPPNLADLVARCLAKNVDDRPARIQEAVEALYPGTIRYISMDRQQQLQREALEAIMGEEHRRALDLLEELLSLDSHDPFTANNLGLTQGRLDRHEEAEALFRKASHGLPADPALRRHLAWALRKLGKDQAASEQSRRARVLEFLAGGWNESALFEAESSEEMPPEPPPTLLMWEPVEIWRGGDNRSLGSVPRGQVDPELEALTARACRQRTEAETPFPLPQGTGCSVAVDTAWHSALDRSVTITHFQSRTGCNAPWLVANGGRWACLHHPNIVPIYDIATHRGRVYVVSEPVKGSDLQEFLENPILEKRKLPPRDFRRMVFGLVSALHHAHQQRVLHGALCLDSVVLEVDGSVKLLRFPAPQLAAVLDGWGNAEPLPSVLFYQAPEQFGGHPTVACDVYSLAMILYRVVAGSLPFQGPDILSLYHQIVHEVPPRLEVPDGFPPVLAEVVEACLRKQPADRPPSVGALLAMLYPDEAEPERDQERLRHHHRRALEALRMGRLETAVTAWREVLERDPGHGPSTNNVGVAFARMDLLEIAESLLRKAVGLLPASSFTVKFNLGWVLYERSKRTEARQWLEKAALLHPMCADAFHLLGQCKTGPAAISEFRRALEIDPKQSATHLSLADELEVAGLVEEARSHRATAEALGPMSGEIWPRVLTCEPPRGWEGGDNTPRDDNPGGPLPEAQEPDNDDGGGGAGVPRRRPPYSPFASEAKEIPLSYEQGL